MKFVNVISLKKPLFIKIDGIDGKGIVLKEKSINLNKMDEEESTGI